MLRHSPCRNEGRHRGPAARECTLIFVLPLFFFGVSCSPPLRKNLILHFFRDGVACE